jgi:hypothetical protein
LAASQEIPRISRNPKVHYRTHKRSPPVALATCININNNNNNNNKTALIINITVLLTLKLPKTDADKITKYENLALEIKRIWKLNKVFI